MIGVRVGLSSGDSFYLVGELGEAMCALNRVLQAGGGLMEIGGRAVNPAQITQLTLEQIPSIESPERLYHEEVT